jgi:hypothetical protein
LKVALAIFALVLVAVLLYADFKWRQWMYARRRERGEERDGPVN